MNTANVQIARIGFKQAVFVAIISGLFGLIGALIQYNIQKPTTKPQMIGFFSQKIPIGSIFSSILEPKDFSKLAGDEGGFDPTSSTWVPADGRRVSGSKYSKALTTQVPDLRGMFIRGLNYSEDGMVRTDKLQDPEGNDRTPGHYQEDAIKSHNHFISKYRADTSTRGSRLPSIDKTTTVLDFFSKDGPVYTTENVDKLSTETRPRNIALYYYVRIN